MRRVISEEDPCLDRSTGRLNPLTEFVLPATLCPIFALSARICFFSTAVPELEYSCLSAKLCRFWRPFNAVSDTSHCSFACPWFSCLFGSRHERAGARSGEVGLRLLPHASLAVVLVVAAVPEAGLVASAWRAVQPFDFATSTRSGHEPSNLNIYTLRAVSMQMH
jgi:hypothetical protein